MESSELRAISGRPAAMAFAAFCAAVALAFSLTAPAAAQQSTAIAQGFNASGDSSNLVAGAMVSTKAGSTGSIELATLNNANRLVGVIGSQPLLAMSNGEQQVHVVLGGRTEVLVSDINGPVRSGDRITVSAVSGVGMRATADGQIVGIAQADQAVGDKAVRRTVNDLAGKPHEVQLGTVPLQVGIASFQAPGSNFLPPVIQRIANSVAGRQVSLVRVLISGTVLMTAIFGIFILLHASARAGMISIGRNPIAAGAVHRGLFQVGLLAAIILISGLAASYLLIRL